MTDTMEVSTKMQQAPGQALAGKIATEDLAAELLARADAEGVSLIGPGGLLAGLTKIVLETALEAEMTEHLGYEAHDPSGHHSGNSRNGGHPLGCECACPDGDPGSWCEHVVAVGLCYLDEG